MVVGLVIGSTQVAGRLLTLVSPRVLMCGGFLVAAIGMFLLTLLQVDSGYLNVVMPAEVLLGLGMGTAFVPAMSMATRNVEDRDTGVASAMVNAVQQVGEAVGTALLNAIAAGTSAAYLAARGGGRNGRAAGGTRAAAGRPPISQDQPRQGTTRCRPRGGGR
ncbi:hypothetical protein GCM10022402_28230 [Salinactinospora qingdaonensis]|uniref:Major Facilitator Superfamily protein n=2 Tax=Salinactinospora qingdaonensis TaxID=702744 RepID=A0ABP7FVT8_9ACTN